VACPSLGEDALPIRQRHLRRIVLAAYVRNQVERAILEPQLERVTVVGGENVGAGIKEA
jgi:hypothetical protein